VGRFWAQFTPKMLEFRPDYQQLATFLGDIASRLWQGLDA
jgi:hypothetical protein